MLRSVSSSGDSSGNGSPKWTAYIFRRSLNGIEFDERTFARILMSGEGAVVGADVSWRPIKGESQADRLADVTVNATLSAALLENEYNGYQIELVDCASADLVYRTYRRTQGQQHAMLHASVPVEALVPRTGEGGEKAFSEVTRHQVQLIVADETVIGEDVFTYSEEPWNAPLNLELTQIDVAVEVIRPPEASEQVVF
jgi:hypothetical protein